jgi:Tfp pilus assembly protein PilV
MLIFSNKGMGLIEIVIAILLTSVGVIAILSLQGSGWKTVARSDYLGRAAGILYQELETVEATLMNPCNAIPGSSTKTVYTSGQGAVMVGAGDASFAVQTTITNIGANIWRVTVTVRWPPINNTGITEHLIVTRQEGFRFPLGCT